MQTVIVTDAKYRSAIAAVRALGRAGYKVVAVQTRGDCSAEPPAFVSRYVFEARMMDCSVSDERYTDELAALIREYGRPILFCVGAATLAAVSEKRDLFAEICDFLISPPDVLLALNDKEAVHRRAQELSLPVPKEYRAGEAISFPVVVKPHCGEKFGLKAKDRYAFAENEEEYERVLAAMSRYDPEPIVQEKISGEGGGASLLLDRDGHLVCAVCHRRIREYPITGGPSTCCESMYDEGRIDAAYRLLASFGFTGMAMVEFKGGRILEVNPRIWGSFPLTDCAGSPFAVRYVQAALGEAPQYDPHDCTVGVRMRFLINDAAATLQYLLHGKLRAAFGGIADVFRAKEALRSRDDAAPFRRYMRNTLLRK